MESIINSILEAETKAEAIISDAKAKSKQITLQAGEEAFKIKEAGIDAVKSAKKAELENANSVADAKYSKIIEEGKIAVQNFTNQANQKVEGVAESVFEGITK